MATTHDVNHKRLAAIARDHGLVLNSDAARVQKVVGLMAGNFDAVGEWICPCKQQHNPPIKGRDKTCPCPEWLDEIARDGHCYCRLFYVAR